MTTNDAKSFDDILAISFSLHNLNFNSPTKLFSDVYLIKFLNMLAKSFSSCTDICVQLNFKFF